ncbi:MAG: HEAT repeat domain-containing protein [Myxococcaceae bacterium]|nr:HEAT repeat domain-containing protein [Myxococcaceae bacterium]
MRLLLWVALWPGLGFAGAAFAEKEAAKRAEAVMLAQALLNGQARPAAVANRASFLGQEVTVASTLANGLSAALSPAQRRDIFEALALLKHPTALAPLEAGLTDDDGTVRMLAAQGVGKIGNPKAAPKLAALLSDKNPGVRKEAARSLGMFGNAAWSKALVKAAAAEGESDVRAVMLVAVGLSKDRKQESALVRFLDSSSQATRLSAGRALCLLGSPKGLGVAKKQLASAEPAERLQGVLMLEGVAAGLSRPLLLPRLEDADKAVAAASARVLYQGGEQPMLTWLLLQSFHAQSDDKRFWERELETLRLSPEQRDAILTKAGLR